MTLLRGLVSARTWLAFTHHVLGLAVAVVSCTVVVAGFAVGLCLTPLALVGLPVLGLTVRFATAVGCAERGRFDFFLGLQIPRWPPDPRRRYFWKVVAAPSMMQTRATWGEISYAVLRLPASLIAVALTMTL
jgi:hypothetical protein